MAFSVADIAAFANPFGTPSKGKWNLSPGVWIDSVTKKQVTFFTESRAKDAKGSFTAIDQINDTGARRLAVYEYPYQDGQRVKDLGRKGETYTFNIKFHGPDYQTKLREFYQDVYLSNNVGKLQHPVLSAIRGAVDCRLQSFEPVHRAEETNSVTFRAVFIEDNGAAIDFASLTSPAISAETSLQKALQNLVSFNTVIQTALASTSAILSTPAQLTAALQSQRIDVVGKITGLLGQLAATFSNGSDTTSVLAAASGSPGGIIAVNNGTVQGRTASGSSKMTSVPPVFQVGVDPAAAALVQANISNFVSANQVTPSQAVFGANQARSQIAAAIAAVEAALGNAAYDVVVTYRQMAVDAQETVEACIAASQSKVKIYVVPRNMSLRAIAFANGLSPDRQNDIEKLNPYLGSVNLVPKGSSVTVPAA